jgi:hypothetical protein
MLSGQQESFPHLETSQITVSPEFSTVHGSAGCPALHDECLPGGV